MILPFTVSTHACPEELQAIIDDGSSGDFTVTWMKEGLDDSLMDILSQEWNMIEEGGDKVHKLTSFSARVSVLPNTLTRSDHASF
jgi:hypothetical protein